MEVLYYFMDEKGKFKREVREIEDKLEIYQELVDGHIEVYQFTDDLIIICDEEAKLKEKQVLALVSNQYSQRLEPIAGNFIVCRIDEEDFAGLNISTDLEVINSMVIPL